MRGETWVSLAACLVGASVPLAWIGPQLAEGLFPWVAAGMTVTPFALVAGTAWAVRRDRRAARVAAAVAVVVLTIALVGWSWAAQDPDGIALALAGLFVVPGAQVLTWFGGAIVSGRRPPP